MRFKSVFYAVFLHAAVSSVWAAPAQNANSNQYTVLESFEVGDNVNVRSILNDEDKQSLWVGTSVGVLQVDLKTRDIVQTYTRAEGLANEYVFALFKGQDNALWFGTNGGGATRLKHNQWKTYFPMHGLADYWVYAFNEQSDGTLWIGTWNGVNRFDPSTGKITTYVKELVNEWVYAVAVDSKDRVWFGTEGGISMLENQRWQEWTHKNGLGAPNKDHLSKSNNTGLGTRHRHNLDTLVSGKGSYNENYVFSLLVTDDDTVWAGTWGGGVSYFNFQTDKNWHNLTKEDGLAGNIVYSIARDNKGAFWFGTDQGLSRYDGGSDWQNYTMNDGLLGSSVYAVAITADNHVWAGTRRGVTHLIPK